ncbi:unnamed protein product [Rhodiola kirilowii]
MGFVSDPNLVIFSFHQPPQNFNSRSLISAVKSLNPYRSKEV